MSKAVLLLSCAVALIACSSDNDRPLRVINGPASVETTTTIPTPTNSP